MYGASTAALDGVDVGSETLLVPCFMCVDWPDVSRRYQWQCTCHRAPACVAVNMEFAEFSKHAKQTDQAAVLAGVACAALMAALCAAAYACLRELISMLQHAFASSSDARTSGVHGMCFACLLR